jgi:hypothetical protein
MVSVADAEPARITYTVGADAQLAFGTMIAQRLGTRFELGVAPGHAVVLRGGVGETSWFDNESDDPIYREIMSRVGYRRSSRRLFAGGELGVSWFKPEYPPEVMNRESHWFNDVTLTALAGVRIGPARLSLDYNHDLTSPVRQVGLQLGVDFVTL